MILASPTLSSRHIGAPKSYSREKPADNCGTFSLSAVHIYLYWSHTSPSTEEFSIELCKWKIAYLAIAWIPYLWSTSTPPALLVDFPTRVGNRERKCKWMSLHDVAALVVAIANLILRVWEMRKDRRRNSDDPDQLGDWFRIRQLGRNWQLRLNFIN